MNGEDIYAQLIRDGVPRDEITDMNKALAGIYKPTSSDLRGIDLLDMGPNSVQGLISEMSQYAAKSGATDPIGGMSMVGNLYYDRAWTQHDQFQKAYQELNVHTETTQEERRKLYPKRGAKGAFIDRQGAYSYNVDGLSDRPTNIGWEPLKAIVEQIPVFNACIITRQRQVQRFCRPVEREAEVGFQIVKRYIERKWGKDGSGDLDWRRWMARFFQHSGDVFQPRGRKKLKRDTLSAFLAKLIRDRYTYDAPSIETERNFKDKPVGLYALDGATIRLLVDQAVTVVENGKVVPEAENPFAAQVIQQRPVAAFTHGNLIYEPQNVRTDVRILGYGYPETEQLVRAATGWINSMMINIRAQDENRIPPGLLNMYGDYGEDAMRHFRQHWNAMVRGVNQRWALPVLWSKNKESGASFEKFGVEFNEMYFAKWMTFLTAIICAIFGMDPTEINFESFSGGTTSSLSGSDTAEKLASAKDKGLEPLLAWLASIFTDFIVADYDPDYEFVWRGLHPELMEARAAAVEAGGTVNEYREIHGMDPIPEDLGWGELPMNPAIAQYAVENIESLKPDEPEQGLPPGMQPDQAQQLMDMNAGTTPQAPDGQPPGISDKDMRELKGGAAEQPGATAEKPRDEKDQEKEGKAIQGRFRKAYIEVLG